MGPVAPCAGAAGDVGPALSLEEAREAAEAAGLDTRSISLIYDTKESMSGTTLYGSTAFNGGGQLIRDGSGRFVVYVTRNGLSSPEEAVNTIGHELYHVRQALNGVPFGGEEDVATVAGEIAQANMDSGGAAPFLLEQLADDAGTLAGDVGEGLEDLGGIL